MKFLLLLACHCYCVAALPTVNFLIPIREDSIEEVAQLDEERIEQIVRYLDRHGIDIYDSSCDKVLSSRWNFLAQDLTESNYCPLLIKTFPVATSKTRWVLATTLIASGAALCVHPLTRSIGVRLIKFGISLIGYDTIDDFCQYLKTGWGSSEEEWNIFEKILGEVMPNTYGGGR